MPKELFNQSPLGEGQEPADADRIALGQPGQAGAVNMTWAQLKAILGADAERSSIKFDVNNPPIITQEGEMYWNGDYHTIAFDSGLGKVKIGQELYLLYYNDTGATITAGSILHLKSATDVGGGVLIPTPELADASKWELTQGTLSIACCDILDGELGLTLKDGIVEGVDTSGVAAGAQLWLSDDGSGQFTDTKPVFPSYSISVGGSFNSQADGKVLVSITKDIYDTFGDAWDGAIRESFNFTTSSDGVTVTGLLENKDNTKNLTLLFADGLTTLDTTTSPVTIALTAGTDSVPQTNYVYIPSTTKELTVSTSGWPTTEHSKIAQLEVGDPVTVQSEGGCVRNQNINDHIKEEGDNGHILHIAERVRQLNAQWDNGTEGTFDNTGGNGYIIVTGGQVWQLHKQSFPALNMITGDYIRIVNDFTTPFRRTQNLATITAYSDGTAWNNEWSKIVVWGVANKSGEPSFLMCNLPSDGYNSEANALADALNYADYSIPKEYKGVGFLIGAFVIRISGGVITYNGGYQDLRGFVPNNIAGGGGGGGGGVTTFLALTDTPSAFAGFGGYTVKVNEAATALEFTPIDYATENIYTLSAGAIDFDSKNEARHNEVQFVGNTTFTFTNDTNARELFLQLIVGDNTVLTFPSGTDGEDNDSRWSGNVFTATDAGYYNFHGYKDLNTGYWRFEVTPKEAKGSTYTEITPFNPALDFSSEKQFFANYAQAAPIAFTLAGISQGHGAHIEGTITASGDAITITSDFYDYSGLFVANSYTPNSGDLLDLYFFLMNDGKARINLKNLGGGVVPSPPQITSATVENAADTDLVVVFDEVVTITDTTGLSLNFTSGTPKTLTGAVSGSGTNTLTFTISASVENGDVFTLEVLDTNNIIDSEGTNVDAISQAVTNNVVASNALTFQPANLKDLVDNTDGTYTGSNGALWESYGLADQSFTGNQSLEIDIPDVAERCMIGFRDDNINSKFDAGYDFYLLNNGTTYRYGFNSQASATNSGINVVSGDRMRLRRDGSSVFAEYFRGGSWTLIHDFTADQAISGTTYLQIATDLSTIYNPVLV